MSLINECLNSKSKFILKNSYKTHKVIEIKKFMKLPLIKIDKNVISLHDTSAINMGWIGIYRWVGDI